VNERNTGVSRGRVHLVASAAVVCALLALALPAFAAAAKYEVNSVNDGKLEEGSAVCRAENPGECTLRAAIELSNEGTGATQNVIEFINPFNGGAGDEIQLGSELPAITKPVLIVGNGSSPTLGPVVDVIAPDFKVGLTVESDEVQVQEVSFSGGGTGIIVGDASTGFILKDCWFGLKLDGSAREITGTGVILGPGSDNAELGGTAGGNVFTNANIGVYIRGASNTLVQSNYIGVGPSGLTNGSIERGVWISDAPGFPAEDNTIGGVRVAESGPGTCGGECNVIVAKKVGVLLKGDKNEGVASPTGPTAIKGNYLGLRADGTAFARLNETFGIRAEVPENGTLSDPGPGDLTVGGPSPSEGNVIDNGFLGMVAERAKGLLVEGNQVGWLPASGSAGSEPEGLGFVLVDRGLTTRPSVRRNETHLSANGLGVLSTGPGAVIELNKFYGGETGVKTAEDDEGLGNQISGNLVFGPNLYGFVIENNANTLTGNSVFAAGRNGVLTDREEVSSPWPMANRIGGDSPGLENVIEASGEEAISIGGEPETANEVLGNNGAGNGGPFILLREHSAGHPPNREIKPPTLEGVYQSSSSGTALPGAKVRLFGKQSTDPGSLEPIIATAIADASGHWAVSFPTQLALGRLVGATQTSKPETPEGATSEVSAARAVEADPVVPVVPVVPEEEKKSESGATPSTPSSSAPVATPPPAVARVAPRVSIVSGPKKTTEATTARFKFKVTNTSGAKFECKLDRAKWAKCTSPKTYKKLKVGKHTFRVRATVAGLTGAVAKYQFTIKG
jgi:hypothetical protein